MSQNIQQILQIYNLKNTLPYYILVLGQPGWGMIISLDIGVSRSRSCIFGIEDFRWIDIEIASFLGIALHLFLITIIVDLSWSRSSLRFLDFTEFERRPNPRLLLLNVLFVVGHINIQLADHSNCLAQCNQTLS